MSTREKFTNNLWCLGIARDLPTLMALKGRLPDDARGEVWSLRLRGLDRPVLFRPGATDVSVVWELFQGGEYEFIDGWPIRTVVDCGANVGMFLAWVLRNGRGQLERYVGVEPDAASFALLQRQVRSLGVERCATLMNAAVWDSDGIVTFDDSGESWGHRVTQTGRTTVRAATVETILDQAGLAHCDLLKLDVEGAERQVLRGLERWADRVDAIVAELHGELDYAWFKASVEPAGFVSAPAGRLFKGQPGAVRRGSPLERFARA